MKKFNIYWGNFKVTVRHKYYVFIVGLKIGVPLWQLIMHDMSKFLPSEFIVYSKYYCGDGNDKQIKADFRAAWHKHKHRNPHHSEYWFNVTKDGTTRVMEMPEKYVLEMLADMMAAEIAYNEEPNLEKWLNKNFSRFKFHPKTKRFFKQKLLEEFKIKL